MPMYKKSLIALLILIGVVSGGIFYGYTTENSTKQTTIANFSPASNSDNQEITVYVTGEVNKPGVVTLQANQRVADAIKACGNLTNQADKTSVNLAAKLTDGMEIKILPRIANNTKDTTSSKNASTEGKININQADEKAFDALPGVGPAMAKRIVDYRQTHGNFQSTEDLKKVKGIGKAKFEKLQDKITL